MRLDAMVDRHQLPSSKAAANSSSAQQEPFDSKAQSRLKQLDMTKKTGETPLG